MASTGFEHSGTNSAATGASEKKDNDPLEPSATFQLTDFTVEKPALWLALWPIRVGLALLLMFELTYFEMDLFLASGSRALAANVFNVAATVAFFFMLDNAFFTRHWRIISIALFLSLIASTVICSLALNDIEWLFVTVILLMLGTGTLAPWNSVWQFSLTLAALTAVCVTALLLPGGDSHAISHWGALLVAAGLGHCMTVLGERYRTELKERFDALEQNHGILLAQVAQRETAVAERERAFQRLRENEGQLRRVFDTSLDAIAINRLRDGHFVDVNTEFISTMGYRLDEVKERSATELGIWSRPEEWRKLIDQLQRAGTVRNMEVELQTKSGRVLTAQISAAVTEVDSEPCVISVTRDVTSIKGAETELIAARESALAASRAKSEFVSSISHEIRTPMNAILGTADLLSDTALSFEQRHYLETMRDNGNAMLAVVNGVLDLSRVESGRLALESVEFDLRELVEKTLDGLATSAHSKKLELAALISPDVSAVIGDSLRLRQILVNLVGNAIKFTEHGEIVVTVETKPAPAPETIVAGNGVVRDATYRSFRISVSDTGVGIPHDRQGAIFAGFAQGNSSVAREYGGSGLGLAIVRRLVELMNGQIDLESEVGQGSTFTIVLPLKLQLATARAKKSSIAANDLRLRGQRVLVADDSRISRQITEQWLTANGAEVKSVNDGIDALAEVRRARIAASPYNLLLLDARMPGMDGVTLAQVLMGGRRDQPAISEAIVVLLTSDELAPGLSRIRESGLDANANCGYVVKPLKREDLLGAIHRVLGLNRDGDVSPRIPPASATVLSIERPLRILLAEDSVDNRLLIEAFLKQQPYDLEFAENGQIAIDRVIAAHYDLVLMDIQMPVVDGYTAVRRIREWERRHDRPRIPIIALTASALDEAVRMSLDAGCDAHIAKPVRKATLIEAIRKRTSSPEMPVSQTA